MHSSRMHAMTAVCIVLPRTVVFPRTVSALVQKKKGAVCRGQACRAVALRTHPEGRPCTRRKGSGAPQGGLWWRQKGPRDVEGAAAFFSTSVCAPWTAAADPAHNARPAGRRVEVRRWRGPAGVSVGLLQLDRRGAAVAALAQLVADLHVVGQARSCPARSTAEICTNTSLPPSSAR